MKPAPFEYQAPKSLESALDLMSTHGWDAKILAGGQSLVPSMNFRLAQPAVLVDLNGLSELSYIRQESDGLHIGAMTRQSSVERDQEVQNGAPLLSEAMPYIAHIQIRNRGTIGGSVAHSDPASELPAVLHALDARYRLRKQGSERWVAAREFSTGLFETALEPEEILVEIVVPRPELGSGFAFDEIARRHGDYALAGVAATVSMDRQERLQKARIVFFGVGEGPVEAAQAQSLLIGEPPSRDRFRAAAEAVSTVDIQPQGDIHASVAYRRHLSKVLTVRALTRAVDRARASLAKG